MSANGRFSLRVLIGGSIIALVAVTWGIVQWDVQYWFLYVVSVPFVFVSAIVHDRRVYLAIVLLYAIAHMGVDVWTANRTFMLETDIAQWLSIPVSGEIIYQISSQRRRADALSQRRIRELEVMNETLTSISSELDLNTLLQTITARAVKLLGASLGELLLYDRNTGIMEIVAQYPPELGQIGFKMKPGEGAMGRVAVTKRPLILNDYKAFVNALPDHITTGVEATLDVPLLKGDELIGVLGLAHHDKHKKFTADDQSLLIVFASQATVAIENARLYREVQHLAFTDVLTGINNRRCLFELADREYKRSVRYRRPLSLMIIDIDHFKSINDHYGHAVGDEVLKWFAAECNAVIRKKVDMIGRFGGEEFALIYPEISLPSALIAGERLRRHIIGGKIICAGNTLQITFSAGIVSLPFDQEISLDQLFERADKALYHAKQKRNCIAYWDDAANAPVLVAV
ncbi:MAG: GGDEF domain-containing protein [Chloroflexi bacterium]|nr:GGDEF domain-containing protein [Chloroflexota bacterium]